MKNILKGTLHFTELFGILVLAIATGSIPVFVISLIPALSFASKLMDDISGNKINDSIFSVYNNGKIFQNSISHPLRMIDIMRTKDKGKRFVEEAVSMFTQMDTRDKKGNLKLYRTKSQAKTLFLLKQLERNGYIQNLEYKPAGKMHLVVEKIEMGNPSGMNKKHQMYKISFNLTDKERIKEDLMSLTERKPKVQEEVKTSVEPAPVLTNTEVKSEEVVNTVDNTQTRSEESIRREQVKEELLELREQLQSINEEEVEEKGKSL